MKHWILVPMTAVVLLLAAGDIPAAGDPDPMNEAGPKIETFLGRKDHLLVRDIYTLGSITGLYSSSGMISAIVAYEAGGKENRLKGLMVEVVEGQSRERSRICYLDLEEVEGLLTALASMVSLAEERGSEDSFTTEITYTTADGLDFGVRLGDTDKGAYISTGDTGELTLFMEAHQMKEIVKIMDYGRTLLKMK